MIASGSGTLQEQPRAYPNEMIEKVNDLLSGDLTDQDKLVYLNDVLKGELLESATLQEQAAARSSSPTLRISRRSSGRSWRRWMRTTP